MNHNPVTTTIAGPAGCITVHFHCPCGIDRSELVIIGPDGVHPASRYTAAIRRLHKRGRWPQPELDLGDAEAAGWGPPAETAA